MCEVGKLLFFLEQILILDIPNSDPSHIWPCVAQISGALGHPYGEALKLYAESSVMCVGVFYPVRRALNVYQILETMHGPKMTKPCVVFLPLFMATSQWGNFVSIFLSKRFPFHFLKSSPLILVAFSINSFNNCEASTYHIRHGIKKFTQARSCLQRLVEKTQITLSLLEYRLISVRMMLCTEQCESL